MLYDQFVIEGKIRLRNTSYFIFQILRHSDGYVCTRCYGLSIYTLNGYIRLYKEWFGRHAQIALSVKAVLKLHLVQGSYSLCKHFTDIVKMIITEATPQGFTIMRFILYISYELDILRFYTEYYFLCVLHYDILHSVFRGAVP
jgi:hypothetical protein